MASFGTSGSLDLKAHKIEKMVDPDEPDREKELEEKLKEKELKDKAWSSTKNLDKVKYRPRCGKPIGLKWYGDGKKDDSDAFGRGKNFFHDFKFYL